MNISLNSSSLFLVVSQCISLIVNSPNEKGAYISLSSDKYFHDFASIRVDYRNAKVSDWYPKKPDFYIIEADEFVELEDRFRKLSNLSNLSFNPRAKFLFIGQNITLDFLKFISGLYIRDVLFLNPETSELWSPFYYEKENSGSTNINNKIFNMVGICRNISLKALNLYPRKSEENLGISKISAVYIPVKLYACHNCASKGIMLEIFEMIADYLEIRITYYIKGNMPRTMIFENHDVFIRAYTMENFHISEFTMSCFTDEWSWFVPSPELIPRWKYLNNIFELRVWLISFFLILILSVVWAYSRFIFEGEFVFLETTIAVFKLFVEQNHDIRKNYVDRAILSVCIIFFAYFMNIFLKCRFTYLLNGVSYQNDLNSFDDIKNNKIHAGFHPSLIKFINTTREMRDYIEEFGVDCSNVLICLNRTAFQRDIVSLQRARIGRNLIKTYSDLNGTILLKEIKPPFIVMQHVIDFQRGHPLLPIFNKYLFNLVDMGIVKKIVSNYDPKIDTLQESYVEQRALKTEHLVIPLVIWVAGILCGTIIFIIEKTSEYKLKKKEN
ncbi:hypothetical protein HHI36_014351 [Cryptolaemus montrouzieri]|uniref:Ionotropic receptor n=1 Tax=Cryptolaemus montrouzieri TaxID=559131 RepID=A0ABD2N3H3_9CUCU